MAKRENQRVTVTKKMLKDSLISLLAERSIYKISVRELCDRAGVNRTTFYKYYDNQFALLTAIEEDVISLVREALSGGSGDYLSSLTALCRYLDDNIVMVRLLLNNNIDDRFPEKIFGRPQGREAFENVIGRRAVTEAQKAYLFSFMTYGGYQMVRMWANKEKRESPEELSRLIVACVPGSTGLF